MNYNLMYIKIYPQLVILMQEKKLHVQGEQNLTSELIAQGRAWVDAARTHAAAAQGALTVSYNSDSHGHLQGIHTPHRWVRAR